MILALVIGGMGALLGDRGGDAVGTEEARSGEAAIPNRLEVPSPWLPVDETPGRAAVVLAGEHKTLTSTSREGVFVVSATTGEYTWLPLADLADPRVHFRADGKPFALSPDGSLLAYWQVVGSDASPVTSLQIVDLRTGRRQPAPMPGATTTPSLLSWVGDSTIAYVTVDWSATSPDVSGRGTVGMSVRAVRWPTMKGFGPDTYSPGLPVRAIATSDGVTYISTDADGRRLRPSIITRGAGTDEEKAQLLVPDGASVESARIGSPVFIGIVVAAIDGSRLELRKPSRGLPGDPAVVTLDGTVVRELLAVETTQSVIVRDERGGKSRVVRLPFSIQFGGGPQQKILIRGPGTTPQTTDESGVSTPPSYASDLWAVPTVTRPAPETPTSPRLVAGLGAGVIGLVLAVGLLLLRRRRA
ncbi:hypothetical protein KLP28_15195 [Nocardioidaceae bacterium]|nr:hypothetical protein KLP28_15195 [Nocardioidaceae bacterium]